ncbi:MAG: B12-binding domain-containing radical SAM protein [Bacteroidetes bacterium RBG_19FT_COMBO_42_10]|nr:MAG: B12-binding domain-containing radical SAM protein [Bacteroidetes bacterium RBG_19FT_COMBO_42_10]
MNILLVYPQYPDTYWSFKHALKFISKKASNIPLGLITVASLLPDQWNKKLTDLNVTRLKDKDIIWADFVFISAMNVQLASVRHIISRCKQLNTRIVAGGPLFTEEYEQFAEIDHLVLNEAEITLPLFLEDLKNGSQKKIYRSERFADITRSPQPDYSLLKAGKYGSAGIQYSRGCPYDCEFCDITALFGRRVRTKTSVQIISELNQLLQRGWRGTVFFVDDNFIGHKGKLKSELLPAVISWMEANGRPFNFITEASIDLADDKDLMDMMVRACFLRVFVGIETPEENCLTECNKLHNNNRDLKECVDTIQRHGMEVCGGFIVGFDNDPPNIFQRQIDFIQKSGIITAMVGLLNAPRLSKLYQRLKNEGRITDSFGGDNTSYSMNFIPAMDKNELLIGYQKIIQNIYSCKLYYSRVKIFLMKYDPPFYERLTLNRFMAFLKSIIYIGILKKESRYYWRLLLWSLFHKPKSFPLAVTYSIYGYHFRRVFRDIR